MLSFDLCIVYFKAILDCFTDEVMESCAVLVIDQSIVEHSKTLMGPQPDKTYARCSMKKMFVVSEYATKASRKEWPIKRNGTYV